MVLNHLYFWDLHSEKKNLHDKAGLTPLHLATSLGKSETFALQLVLHFVFTFCCHKLNTHSKHDWKVKGSDHLAHS